MCIKTVYLVGRKDYNGNLVVCNFIAHATLAIADKHLACMPEGYEIVPMGVSYRWEEKSEVKL